MKKQSILFQLYKIFVSAIALSFAMLTFIAVGSIRSLSIAQIESELEDQTILWSNIITQIKMDGLIEEIAPFIKSYTKNSHTRITIIQEDGQVLGDSEKPVSEMENHADRPEIISALETGHGRSIRYSDTLKQEMLYSAIPYNTKGKRGVIRAARSIDAINEQLSMTVGTLGIYSLFLLLITSVITWFTAKGITMQLSVLAEAASSYSQGNFSAPMPPKKTIEIQHLSETIDTMAKDLHERILSSEKQKNEIEAMLNSMVEAVVLLNPDLTIKSLNPAATQIFRINEEEVVKKSVLETFHSTKLQDVAESTLKKGFNEKDIIISGPPKRYFRVHATRLSSEKNKAEGVLLVMNDITKMKKLERMRRDFVANVSHELKTPITSIQGFVETLQAGAIKQPEMAINFLKTIEKNSHRLNNIIDDLLSLSRIEQVEGSVIEMLEFSLQDSLRSCINVCDGLSKKKNIPIKLSCPAGLKLKANQVLFEQAANNLINNGLKYSQEGKSIEINIFRKKGWVVVEVKDQGIGIPKKDQSRLFERFFRVDKARSRDVGGTGLGLSIVKHIVMAHGGSVGVQSKLGEGSTFTMKFPQ